MRIHKLKIQAFGPFAGTETINFDELAEGGLFLLDGPTGAGKSSILDAICYALYGSLPGNRTGSRQIRSDHAAAGVDPEVVCELTIGDRRFEVTRSPSWMRPSKRGKNKTTEQKAASLLREFAAGSWEQLSTRNDEVGQVLGGLLGLDRDQFTKVVMLPQGGFADFLRAKAKDREELLANLFDTSDYGAIEEEFSQRLIQERKRTDTIESALTASESAIRVTALNFLAAHELWPAPQDSVPAENAGEATEPSVGDEPQSIEAEFAGYGQRIQDTHLRLSAETSTHRATLAQARTLASALDERVRVFARREELQQLQAQHLEHHPAALIAQKKLELDAKANSVRAFLQRVQEASETRDVTQLAWESAKSRLEAANEFSLQDDADTQERLRDLSAEASAQLAVARAAVGEEQGRASLAGQLEKLTAQAATHRQTQDQAQTQLGVLQSERELLEESELDQEAASAKVYAARESLDTQTTRRDQAKLRDDLDKKVVKAIAAHSAQALVVVDAEKSLLGMQREQLEQGALRLAAALRDGEPCLVCGATEHPNPARADAGAPLIEDDAIAAQETLVQAERKKLELAAGKRDVATTKFESADQAAAGLSVQDLSTAVDAATALLAEATLAQSQVLARVRKLESLRAKIEKETAKAGQAAIEFAAANKAAESAAEQLTLLDAKLEQLRQGKESIGALVVDLSATTSLYGTGHDALRRYREAHAAVLKSEQIWQLERSAIGLSDLAAYHAAFQPDEQRTELRRMLTEDADRASAIRTLEASPDYRRASELVDAGVHPASAEDLAASNLAVTDADAVFEQAREREVLAHTHLSRHVEAVTDLAQQRDAAGPLIESYRRLRGLTEVMRGGGDNLYKMTLSTYVLAARLEEVALAASQRLGVMSGERYSLHHDDSKQGNSKSGLGLQVLDSWTGKRRETQTLSGGETFMASLALALGLADVISHHSGAVDMQTLFVDEGFGSLDADTLEQVMTALENLRAGGRTIGLVSHVAEMKQRITNRVTVLKTQHGSSIEHHGSQLISL